MLIVEYVDSTEGIEAFTIEVYSMPSIGSSYCSSTGISVGSSSTVGSKTGKSVTSLTIDNGDFLAAVSAPSFFTSFSLSFSNACFAGVSLTVRS